MSENNLPNYNLEQKYVIFIDLILFIKEYFYFYL
jgi:hypothetical protein